MTMKLRTLIAISAVIASIAFQAVPIAAADFDKEQQPSSATPTPATDADEKAIRELIAKWDRRERVPEAADSIFWSGAYKRPRVRGQSQAEYTADSSGRVSSTLKTTVRRIEFVTSRDMAYEFSDGEVTRTNKTADGKLDTASFTNSILRVWRKVDGEWRIAATFMHPHQD